MIATQVLKDTYRFWNPNASDFIQGNLFNKHIAYLDPSPTTFHSITIQTILTAVSGHSQG